MDNDIRSIRKMISAYQIGIRKEKDMLFIDGSEKEKRQLMSRLITSDSYDNFVLKDEVLSLIHILYTEAMNVTPYTCKNGRYFKLSCSY